MALSLSAISRFNSAVGGAGAARASCLRGEWRGRDTAREHGRVFDFCVSRFKRDQYTCGGL